MEPKEYTEPKKLLQIIDREINMHFRREEDFDIGKLVGSYDMAENYRPIVEQYVTDVRDLFSRTFKKVSKNIDEIGEGLGRLGMIASTAIGAGIGAVVGYLVASPSAVVSYAIGGALIGYLVEELCHPSALFIAYKYVCSEVKGCKEPRAIYRNNTLLKLENLS